MKSGLVNGVAFAMVLSAAAPAFAQWEPNRSEDARIAYLRRDDLCQLHIGAFMGLSADKYAPSPADLALLARASQLVDRIIYDAQQLEREVGSSAASALVATLLPAWNERMMKFNDLPDVQARMAALRADLTPGLTTCLDNAEALAKPPG